MLSNFKPYSINQIRWRKYVNEIFEEFICNNTNIKFYQFEIFAIKAPNIKWKIFRKIYIILNYTSKICMQTTVREINEVFFESLIPHLMIVVLIEDYQIFVNAIHRFCIQFVMPMYN